MADPVEYAFSHKEVVTALIKQQGLHTGRWSLTVQFGFSATNIGTAPESADLTPAAIVPVLGLGLRATKEATSLSVDAAEVNPKG